LFYSKDNALQLQAYSDADWGTCRDSARSLIGSCVVVGSSLISWKNKKQKTVAKSSIEAEYRSLSATTSKLEWIYSLMQDLYITPTMRITLFCDNKTAQPIEQNPVFDERTKYIRIDFHYTMDKLLEGFLQTAHVPSREQLADLMTKPLGEAQHSYLASRLGLLDSPLSSQLFIIVDDYALHATTHHHHPPEPRPTLSLSSHQPPCSSGQTHSIRFSC